MVSINHLSLYLKELKTELSPKYLEGNNKCQSRNNETETRKTIETVAATQSWLLEKTLVLLLTSGRNVRGDNLRAQAANCVSHSSPVLAPFLPAVS